MSEIYGYRLRSKLNMLMAKTFTKERLLWHGTSWDCVPNIVRPGLRCLSSF